MFDDSRTVSKDLNAIFVYSGINGGSMYNMNRHGILDDGSHLDSVSAEHHNGRLIRPVVDHFI